MNKYLTLSLAVLASQAIASEVQLGSAVSFNANSVNENVGHVGMTLNAEHHRELSQDAGYFVGLNTYVSPAAVKNSAPVSANLVLGGSIKNPVAPASAQVGLSLEVMSTDSEDKYHVAPGLYVGGTYNMTENWALKSAMVSSFPANKYGEFSGVSVTSSLGLSRSIAVDA